MLLLLFVLFPSLVISDSIILQNDCKRTSEQCFITLEVIKGEPKKDCSIFSTVDRVCSIGLESPTPVAPDEGIQVTETDGGTVVSWTGQKVKGNGTESNTLTASSIWQRIKRQVKGQVVNCTCTPVRRQKRQAGFMSESSTQASSTQEHFESFVDSNGCLLGFAQSGKTLDPSTDPSLEVITASIVDTCALFCSINMNCTSFAYDPSLSSSNCVYLRPGQGDGSSGPFSIYEKC